MSDAGHPSDGDLERRRELTEQVRAFAAAAANRDALYPVRARNAVACGQALVALRPLLPHGQWDKWLTTECRLTRMTASRYMRLSRSFDTTGRLICIRGGYVACGVTKLKPGEKRHAHLFPFRMPE